MKKIRIKEIEMSDFKGQTRVVELKEKNMVLGANGSGKTTILKSVLWLLTGKDTNGKSNVELFDNTKTLTKDTPPAKVTAVIDIDGTEHRLSRQAVARFKRPKGQTEYIKDASDDYKFFIDDIPVTSTEFNTWVSNTMADNSLLQFCLCGSMFSNVAANDKMAAREILTRIIGETEPEDKKFDALRNIPIDDTITRCRYRNKLARETISTRETEAEIARRELAELKKENGDDRDFESEIKAVEEECKEYVEKIDGKMKAYNEYINAVEDYTEKRQKAIGDAETVDKEIEAMKTDREQVIAKIAQLKSQLDSNATQCPFCGTDITMTKEKRKEVNKMVKELVDEAVELKEKITAAKTKKKEMKDNFPEPPKKVRQPNINWEKKMHGEALSRRSEIMQEYETCKTKMNRISELEAAITTAAKTVRDLSIEIAENERTLILAEEYRQAKADLLSQKINGLLQHTRIEMFELQKNGEMKPSCTITNKDGVKLTTMNMASKLLCEVELSRMFCNLLGVDMPCFIDECSVFDSEHLPKIEGAQMIYMKCSDDTSLKVQSE